MPAHYIHLGAGFSSHGHSIAIENSPKKGEILTATGTHTASWIVPLNLVKTQVEFNFPTTDGTIQVVSAFVPEAEMGDGLVVNFDFSHCPTYLILGCWVDAPGHISISFKDLEGPNHPLNLPTIVTLIKGNQ